MIFQSMLLHYLPPQCLWSIPFKKKIIRNEAKKFCSALPNIELKDRNQLENFKKEPVDPSLSILRWCLMFIPKSRGFANCVQIATLEESILDSSRHQFHATLSPLLLLLHKKYLINVSRFWKRYLCMI